MIRTKICCIKSSEEAALAVRHGASALGLVGEMPSGPGVIEDRLIAEIAASVPPPVATFLLTSRTDADGIIDHVRRCRTTTVQIVDTVAPGVYEDIRTALPEVKIVQVVHVTGWQALAEARARAPLVDALLLDSGQPGLERKELGGTGRVHDWAISREIVLQVGCPVFLAGGLRPENVAVACREVRPYGVDLCNGVRHNDRLDPGLLGAFFRAVAAVDQGSWPRA